MAVHALENVLQDFGKRARATDRGMDPATLATIVSTRSDPAITQEMLEAELTRAEAALLERMSSEHEVALELERQRHAGELAELNARLGGEAAVLIEARLSALEETVTASVTSATARILAVHLTAEVQKGMIEGLAQAVRDALQDSEGVRVRIRGPLSLYETLTASLGELSRHLEYTELPGFDLAASIDESLFETRLADWSTALAEAMS